MSKRETRTIAFDCGCFVSFFVADGELREGLACCKHHEAPHQTLEGILASDILYITPTFTELETLAICKHCNTQIAQPMPYWDVTRREGEWAHADSRKDNYQRYRCGPHYENGSCPLKAEPKEAKVRSRRTK